MQISLNNTAKPIILLVGFMAAVSLRLSAQSVSDTAVYTKVMIIPFEERMYFSDSDKAISERSKMSVSKVRRTFRASLIETLERDITTVYGGFYSVNPDLTDDKESDISKIYRSIAYKPEKRKPQPEEKPANEVAKEKLNTIISKAKKEDEDPMKFSGMTSLLDKNGYYDYMNVEVVNTGIFKEMRNKYDTDLFLFINQFELKTNSRTCIDAAKGLYERNFIVHYSVFNADGKQVAGDMLVFPYHNNENRIKMMVYHMFGKISGGILGTMPSPYLFDKQAEEEDEGEGKAPANNADMIRRD